MPDRNIIGNWTTLRDAVGGVLGLGERREHVPEGQERDTAPSTTKAAARASEPGDLDAEHHHPDADDDHRLDERDEQPHQRVRADELRAPERASRRVA